MGLNRTITFVLALICWILVPSTLLLSQERADRTGSIVVTAQKRAQDVQDVPDSITVFDAMYIEDAGIDAMAGMAAHTPGLEFHNFGSRRHSLTFMRGIKSVHAAEPATGFYVDGVNYSKSYMFDFPLFDVERIEVLKGPQGSLYGRNTMGGVINVYTRDPGNEAVGETAVTLGSDNLAEFRGHLRTPVKDERLFLGISGLAKTRDGYLENDTPALGQEGRHTEGGAGRIKLKYLPSDRLDITFNLDGQTYDEGAFPFRRTQRNAFVKKGILPRDEIYHYSHDFEGTADTDFWGTALNTTLKLGAGTLSSITGFRDYRVDEFFDSDFSPLDMTRIHYIQKEKSFSQEIRMVSAEAQPFQWLAGATYFNNRSENRSTTNYRSQMTNHPSNPFSPDTGNRQTLSDGTNQGAALFGQSSWPLGGKWELTLGLRYEHEKADMKREQQDMPDSGGGSVTPFDPASERFDALVPKVGLTCRPTEDHMVYATFSGGYRSGGFNKRAPVGSTAYGEENSRLYEIGTKLSLMPGKFWVSLAGFYMDIEDEQIAIFDTDMNTPYLVNAGESHRLGLEAELRYTPVPGFLATAGVTVLEAEYDSYADPALGVDFSGNQVFSVPKYALNLGLQYRSPLFGQWNFLGRMDLSAYGKRYFDDANTVEEKPYGLINLKMGVEGKHLDIYLWANNLLDHHYVLFENTAKGFAEDGPPLTTGITVGYRF